MRHQSTITRAAALLFSTVVLGLAAGYTRSEPSCKMTVYCHYSGCGEDGGSLGWGTFSEEFEIRGGDRFYEDYNGHWIKEKQKKYDQKLICEITSVDGDSVTWIRNGAGKRSLYGHGIILPSMYQAADGINYDYMMVFSELSAE